MPRKVAKHSFALQCTAYHEAGHAVAALALDRAVKRVSIVPDGEREILGHCLNTRLPSWFQPDVYRYDIMDNRTRLALEREILVLLSGPVAEARFKGRHNWRGARGDISAAYQLAGYLCSSTRETNKYIDWLIERVRNLLDSYHGTRWRAVRYIARELLSKKTINGKTTRELCRKAADDRLKELLAKQKTKTAGE
jgi:hypothetical protein